MTACVVLIASRDRRTHHVTGSREQRLLIRGTLRSPAIHPCIPSIKTREFEIPRDRVAVAECQHGLVQFGQEELANRRHHVTQFVFAQPLQEMECAMQGEQSREKRIAECEAGHALREQILR